MYMREKPKVQDERKTKVQDVPYVLEKYKICWSLEAAEDLRALWGLEANPFKPQEIYKQLEFPQFQDKETS